MTADQNMAGMDPGDNVNRGYTNLEVWVRAMDLFRMVSASLRKAGARRRPMHLTSATIETALAVPSEIAEGYCRRSSGEYLYFLNAALGSLGALRTRLMGLRSSGFIPAAEFQRIDTLHSKTEQSLLSLIHTLEIKRRDESWDDDFKEPREPYIH